MNHHIHLLQIPFQFTDFKFALLCLLSAFVVTLITIPNIIALIRKYKLYDVPNERKEHQMPVPTMGGIAVIAGMFASLALWFPFTGSLTLIAFFFSVVILFGVGIMDDLKDLSAKYKFVIQLALALLMATAGIRITSFEGLFGIQELNLQSQYIVTVLAITGITNAFNLIDGIDGLAGGLGFMSLITLGLFLTAEGDGNTALIVFALAGGILAFLYFNLNPARIFMGDTGSLVLGFVISVMCIRLIQVNASMETPVLTHAPLFVLGITLIPVFDTIRVFGGRIWRGYSPFKADKTHIHHLLTTQGYTHAFAAKVICIIHGLVLLTIYWMQNLRQEWQLLALVTMMLTSVWVLRNMKKIIPVPHRKAVVA